MEAVNCPRCGKVFTKIKSSLCPSCEREEEQSFQIVRKYIDENENCTLSELSQETGVSSKRILGYIREGRLEISKGMRGEIHCRKCGRPITTGQYCDTCVIKINQNMYDMFSHLTEKQKQGAVMHISDKRNK